MVYIKSFKEQSWLLPLRIEDLIPEDHVCFFVESLADSLDYSSFDKKYEGAGHPAYHPRIILKLLIMGVLDKVRSSRKLARCARENVVYMHLAEKLAPDFHTISDFRKNNPELIGGVFTHVVLLAKQSGLLNLTVLNTDGTKIKACASNQKVFSKEELFSLKSFVEKELEEWAKQDDLEEGLFGELRGNDQVNGGKEKIRKVVQEYVKKFKKQGSIFKDEISGKLSKAIQEAEGVKKVSFTDPESRFMKNKKGRIELSYNSQVTVDAKGFILASDVCQDACDVGQLEPQVNQTEKNIGVLPETVKWNFDNGYFSGKNLAFLERKKIDGHIPDQELAQKQKGKKPRGNSLIYDEATDTYQSTNGDVFSFQYEYFDKDKGMRRKEYVLKNRDGKIVKTVKVYEYDGERRRMKSKMQTNNAKETYKLRSQTAEPVFGDVKENKGLRSFLTRSLQTVKIEFNLVCIAHNIQKLHQVLKLL